MQAYTDPVDFLEDPNGIASALVPKMRPSRAVRSRAQEAWARETYIDDNDNIHYISFDPSTTSYLLESSIRQGLGHERQEAEKTVADIEAAIGTPGGTQDIVEHLVEELSHNPDAFPEWGEAPDLQVVNPPLEEDDILLTGRGAAGLSADKREEIRQMMAMEPVRQDNLPNSVKVLS